MFKQSQLKLIHAICAFYLWSSMTLQRVCCHRILGLIFLGLMSRLLPHLPNCTAMNAIALFSICSLGNLSVSLISVFATMLLSDLVFGFHSSIVFVYFSFGLIVLMGYGLKSKRSLARTTFFLTLSSFLFFAVTNFGIWLEGSLYPKTVIGLELCYLAAIPFLINNLIGTLLYGYLLFTCLAIAERRLPGLALKNLYSFDLKHV